MKRQRLRELLVLLLIIVIQQFTIDGQSPPIFDKNWTLNTSLSDEFNSTSFDYSKWIQAYCDDGCWGEGAMHPLNIILNGSTLKLKIDSMVNPWDASKGKILWAAGIYTQNFDYTYGYLEIRAKLPGYYNNGQACGQGFWPCFWTYFTDGVNTSVDCDPGPGVRNPVYHHREIDILEPSGTQYDGKTNVSGWWTNQITNACPQKYGEKWFKSATPMFADFHKFAVEWLPNRIVLYYDDVPYYSVYNDPSVPDYSHRIVIDQQLSGGINKNTPLPQYMEIDYFRYYQINNGYCTSDASINSNSDISTFQYGVRKNLTIGNSSSLISLSSSDNITFRASNEITINGDFTAPLGSELNLIPTPCP